MTLTQTHLIQPQWESISTPSFSLSLLIDHPSQTETPQKWTWKKRVVRIGTHSENDLTLEGVGISRFHFKIEADSTGHCLVDLESKNGLYLNGIRVREAYLREGLVIQVGAVYLQYEAHLEDQVQYHLSPRHSFGALRGKSKEMREIFALLERVSQTDMTVLIEGESGTGKELAARGIHEYSVRGQNDHPFIPFDCSSIPHHLVESALFGHRKGAFTGANQDRKGAILSAHGGTLFLDEIGELPLDLQPRLLRMLERQEIKPVGEDQYQKVDVRIIAATHQNLKQRVDEGLFRLDLYYRLAIVQVQLPALRYHLEDLPDLVEFFINELSPHSPREISYQTMLKLKAHSWPGNVRELRNVVTRAIALSTPDSPHLETRFLVSGEDTSLTPSKISPSENETNPLLLDIDHLEKLEFKEAKTQLIDQFELLYWTRLLTHTQFNVSAAARIAGIHRKSAEYLIKKLGLKTNQT